MTIKDTLRFEEFSLILIKREDSKFNFSNLLNIKNGQADKVSSYSFLGKDWNIKAEDISLLNGIITFKDMKSGRVICLKGISCCAQEFSFLTE